MIQFRYKLDRYGSYFTSDGAIKIFQTVQYKENGFLSLECLYPGKSLDLDFKNYPISYPWAIFSDELGKEKCVLEYPPFFYWLGSLLLYVIPVSLLLYLPILFYSFAIFYFDKILQSIGFVSLFRIFIVILSFFSFPLLTSLDYTESPLFICFYLAGFHGITKVTRKDFQFNLYQLLGIGGFFGLAFLLRLEVLIPFAFLLSLFLLSYKEIKPFILVSIGFLLVSLFFVLYNLKVSGHPLGFRYVSSIDQNQNSNSDFVDRLLLLKAYLWGDKVMVGIFQFNPVVYFLLIGSLFLRLLNGNNKSGNLFLFAGLMSIICIPFYVTFYGGVGYFGLRYLEAPYFLIVIGFGYYAQALNKFRKTSIKFALFVFFGIIFYFNLLTTREGLKVLRSSSVDLSTLHKSFDRAERFVIHTSLYSSIWMGKSFLEKIHVLTTTTDSFHQYLSNIKKGEEFVVLETSKNIYISSDIPEKLHNKYLTSVNIKSDKIEILEESEIFGMKRYVAKKK